MIIFIMNKDSLSPQLLIALFTRLHNGFKTATLKL